MRVVSSCLLLGCLLLNSFSILAQQRSETPAGNTLDGNKDWTTEPLVIRRWDSRYSYNPDETSYREQTFAVSVQSEAALRSFSVLAVPFAGNFETVQFLYARVRHTDGTVVETPVDASFEEPAPVTREAPLYSDLKQRELPIKNLRVGDTLEWSYRVNRSKPEAQGAFWGRQDWAQGVVALSESVEVRVPAASHVTVWVNPETKPESTVTVEGAQRVYHWTKTALAPTVGPLAEAAKKQKDKALLSPAEQLDATYGKLPDIAWTSFPSWEALGSWYRSLEAGRSSPNDAIATKVKELTAGKLTLDDKVRAVYAYVAGQVHYVGVDLGIGRYQPHLATEVFDNQYGDCKDKHTLLAAMLQVLGVPSEAVLIGAGIRFNKEIPAPDSFNHVITRAKVGNDEVWLDATEEAAPYRMMVATLRDRDALVVAPGVVQIERTPADPPFPTYEAMKAVGTLDADGNAEEHFTLTQRGDEELFLRTVLLQVTPVQYDELAQKIVANLGFGGTVTHTQFKHKEDPSQPLVMEWDYHREKPGNDWENLRVTPPLMMTLLPAVNEKEPPVGELPLLGAREVTTTAEVTLPAGWSAELPEAVHAKSAYGTYDMTFRYDKGIVYAERHWTLTKQAVPQVEWKSYKIWTDALALGTDPYVQLRRAVAASPPLLRPEAPQIAPSAPGADVAEKYISQAVTAIRENHLDQGQELLDKAKASDPNHASLTGDYGFLAWRRGDHVEALRLYRKELEDHPTTLWVYNDLSRLQAELGDMDGCVETLHRFVAAAPQSSEAASSLILRLSDLHRDQDALAATEASLARLPADTQTNTRFQEAALKAELRGGQKERGAAMGAALLAGTTDPEVMNDTAYALAVANTSLQLAETTIRRAIEELTVESQSWTLDEALPRLRARSELLTASWDTLGYVLFKQGHPEQALPYIEARWRYRPDAEVGEHLGDVQAALQRRDAAIESYEEAIATISPYNALGVRRVGATGAERELRDRLVHLGKSARPAEATSPDQSQKLRTIPLAAALAASGTAEYKLLLNAQGVQRVEPTGARDLEGAETLLRGTKLPAASFPETSTAQLVRVGMLNCHDKRCEIVFLP